MSFLTENPEYLLFAVAALLMLVIVLFIMVTYLTAKYSKLEARFRIFTEGKDGNSLEKMIREAVKASKGLRGEAEEIHKEIDKLKSKTALCYQDVTRPYFERVKEQDDLHKKMYLDMHLWLPHDILLKADKMTMAHSLELRVPFLDKEVWNLAKSLESEYCIKGEESKREGVG